MKGLYAGICSFVCAMLASVSIQAADMDFSTLVFQTEDYPPYNYPADNSDGVDGISIDLLKKVVKEMGEPMPKVKVVAWAKAIRDAETQPGHVVFATTRTTERESKFKWAGPIANTDTVLLALKTRKGGPIKIDGPKMLDKKSKLYVGVVREDVGENLIDAMAKENGISLNKRQTTKPDQAIKQLCVGRIDLFVYEENSAKMIFDSVRKEKGDNPCKDIDSSNLETVYTLNKGELYFAFHKDVPDELIATIQQAIDAVE